MAAEAVAFVAHIAYCCMEDDCDDLSDTSFGDDDWNVAVVVDMVVVVMNT